MAEPQDARPSAQGAHPDSGKSDLGTQDHPRQSQPDHEAEFAAGPDISEDANAESTSRLLRNRSFLGMMTTQFLGAFNDNLFKQAIALIAAVMLATACSGSGDTSAPTTTSSPTTTADPTADDEAPATTAAETPYGSGALKSKYKHQQGPMPSRYWENFD